MKNKRAIKKLSSFAMRTSFYVGLMALSILLMGQETINYSFRPFRPFFQMMHDNAYNIMATSASLGLIALNINLSISLQQIKDREQSEKKYISASNANTKSRLELTRLQERGY